jgi:hypothetical protein
MLELILVLFLLALNFGISAFNAFSVGISWAEVKQFGNIWQKLLLGCGFIMSVCGFMWCYGIVLAFGCLALGWIDVAMAQAILELGYLTIILPVLGAGLAIMVDSWMAFMRERSLLNGGFAAWNTFAMAWNTYSAISSVPGVVKDLLGFFGGDKDKDAIVVAIVIVALALGFLTSLTIVRFSARLHANSLLDRRNAMKVRGNGA